MFASVLEFVLAMIGVIAVLLGVFLFGAYVGQQVERKEKERGTDFK